MFVLSQTYEAAITQLTQRLGEAGLRVLRTFDLQSACADQPGGICPHHGTAPCNCQMTVLLVYARDGLPVSLVVHGCDGQTWLSVEDVPQQITDPSLEATIMQALVVCLER